MKKPIKEIILDKLIFKTNKSDSDSDETYSESEYSSSDDSECLNDKKEIKVKRKHKSELSKSGKKRRIPIQQPVDKNDILELQKPCLTLYDFISIGKVFKKYPSKLPEDLEINEHRYIGLTKISNMTEELEQINNLIGLKNIKSELISQLSYLLSSYKENAFLNTIIAGPPGHGKTELAKLIGQAYFKSNILSKSVFVTASRSQLIGRYLGETAIKTTDLFNRAKGGVLFIDEIYALGNNSSGEDIYSKECIDTLNQLLGENKNTMCIIAGYAEEMDECFFSVNKGLRSRFPWRFDIDKYTNNELLNMFLKHINEKKWSLENNTVIDEKFFKIHKNCFENAGRDIENFFIKCCMEHSRKNFLDSDVKIINNEDVNSAIKIITNIVEKTKTYDEPPSSMYI